MVTWRPTWTANPKPDEFIPALVPTPNIHPVVHPLFESPSRETVGLACDFSIMQVITYDTVCDLIIS